MTMHQPTTPSTMTLAEAQHDMRRGYLCGAPGVLASALAWLAAGVVAVAGSPRAAVLALFVGGMFIFPASIVLARLGGARGLHTAGNPLGALAVEGTVLMLLGLPLAYVVSFYRIEWFFPAMLLVIGGRYLTFATLYGLRTYWALGAALAVMAFVLVLARLPVPAGAFAGAAVELAFALALVATARRQRAG